MKQHYIPRCYLKRFSDNEKSIYTYDKKASKSYQASMMAVCCEKDIYTLSDEYVKKSREEAKGKPINNLTIEKDHFAHDVEPLYSQFLSQLDEIKDEWMSGKDKYRLNYYEKKELALHIATQYLRHPIIGDAEVDNYMRFEQANVDMVKHIMAVQTGNEAFNDLEVKVTCEKPALHARLTYMDYDMLMKCAGIMARNYYVFKVSKGNDFYSSDFPIAVSPHVLEVQHLYSGLVQYGGELMMTLSPSIALSIYDRHYFKDKEELDGCFVEATDKEVRRYNMMQYFYATRHVFCYKNDFRLIEFIYNMRGGSHEYMTPNLNAEVVSGLGRY
jgi:hypothetical protein